LVDVIGVDASRAVSVHPTGTEVYARELTRALLEQGEGRRWRLYFRRAPEAGWLSQAELRVMPFPRLWTHVRLSWEMVSDAPDILFVPSHVLPLIHPSVSLVTVHDLGYLQFPRAHPFFQRLYLDVSTRWNARAASHVLTISEATKADLTREYGVPEHKVTVAYPGRDESLAPVESTSRLRDVKERYGIEGDYFLYLGTLHPRKNLARLIEAFAPLCDRALLVLAGKRGWLTEPLFEKVRRKGLTERVLFPGYIPEEDKAALMSGAVAFVFPSLYEGFGFPALEAQACGCPVITSATSSMPEVAGEGALLVDPNDTAQIREAMERLSDDRSLRDRLVELGFQNIQRFSWTRCAERVLGVIDRLMV